MKCRFCNSTDYLKKFTSKNESVEYFICKNCNCHNHAKNIDTNYDKSYWTGEIKDPDAVLRDFTKEREFKLKNWYGDIPNFINKFENPKVLDIGCGLGYLLSSLKTKNKYGIEYSGFCCEEIGKNFKDIKIFNENWDYIKKIDKSFDIIIAYHIIEHLENPNEFIKTIINKLNKDGIIILGTPIINTFIANYFGKNYRHYNRAHKLIFDLNSLKKLFLKYNLKIFKIEKPYFRTSYFNIGNVLRLLNKNKLSPAYYGSIVTVYAKI